MEVNCSFSKSRAFLGPTPLINWIGSSNDIFFCQSTIKPLVPVLEEGYYLGHEFGWMEKTIIG